MRTEKKKVPMFTKKEKCALECLQQRNSKLTEGKKEKEKLFIGDKKLRLRKNENVLIQSTKVKPIQHSLVSAR